MSVVLTAWNVGLIIGPAVGGRFKVVEKYSIAWELKLFILDCTFTFSLIKPVHS